MRRFFFILFTIILVNNVSSQENRIVERRLSPSLKQFLITGEKKDSLDVIISSGNISLNNLKQGRIISRYTVPNAAVLRVKSDEVTELLKDLSITFIDLYQTPKEELTTGSLDLAVNKVNLAHDAYPAIKGDNINISIKENNFDTTDVDLKGRVIRSVEPSSTITSHASIMATTTAGAGNSSPFALGAAPASYVTSSNFANLFPDADSVFIRKNITIQNHSYGTQIQNYYGVEAAAYDLATLNNSSIVHVFSSGNSGTASSASGYYSGVNNFANLTGNFKMAKNIITVGAIDSFYTVSPLSSRGPAYDGRVKPELVAFGEDGTSGAAAMVSGCVSLLQQQYKLMHNGNIPKASVVKAVLINSADDVAAKNIDYASGYGSLNAYKSLQTLSEDKIIEGSVADNEIKRYTISISPGTAQIKLTIAWIDPPASINATKALVNDIDLALVSPANQRFYPWVLDTKNNQDSLLLDAQRKIDTLNNVEQISIESPAAGTYTIEVKGSSIKSPQQSFAIAWQADKANEFYWTFPTANEKIIAGATNVIRWQTNRNENAVIEFSTDGILWKTVDKNMALKKGYYKWNSPDTFATGILRVRFLSDSISTDTFVISKTSRLATGFNCADSFLLYWNKLPVKNYQLSSLRGNYLQPIYTTADTIALLYKSREQSDFYSVSPLVNGREGLKSFIFNANPQQSSQCYLRSFFLQSYNDKSASFSASLGSLYNVTSLSFQKKYNGGYSAIKTINNLSNTSFVFTDSSLNQGVNKYRLQLTLSNGQSLISNEVDAYYFNDKEVIIYPNPIRQGEPANVISKAGGRTILQLFNSYGSLVEQININTLLQQIRTGHLAKGIYFVRIIKDDSAHSVEKLLVY